MILQVTTETGSVYRIDYTNKTWERVTETEQSGPVRTDGHGTWHEVKLSGVGFPMAIYGPPVDPAMAERRITTSAVRTIKEVEPRQN